MTTFAYRSSSYLFYDARASAAHDSPLEAVLTHIQWESCRAGILLEQAFKVMEEAVRVLIDAVNVLVGAVRVL
jgi:hypothetical protein